MMPPSNTHIHVSEINAPQINVVANYNCGCGFTARTYYRTPTHRKRQREVCQSQSTMKDKAVS